MHRLLVWNRAVLVRGHGRAAASAYRLMPKCLEAPWTSSCVGPGPILRAHRHTGTDAGKPHRARRVALACEVVSEDDIPRSKTPRRAIADPDFHLPFENKNVLPPGRGVPIARIVRRETAEHEVGARLNRNVVALLSRQREILKMGLAVLASIVRRQGFRDNGLGKLREALAHRVGEV